METDAFEDGWMVSDAHGVMRSYPEGERWEPFALAHARRPGERRTACDEPALGWQIFWGDPFEPWKPGTCGRCSSTIAALRTTTRRTRVRS